FSNTVRYHEKAKKQDTHVGLLAGKQLPRNSPMHELRCSTRGSTLYYKVLLRGRLMSTTLTRKGQVTIPKPVRDLLGLEPGSAVDFKVTDEGQVLLIPAETKKPASRFAA